MTDVTLQETSGSAVEESAATGRGTKELAQAIMGFLEEQAREARAREVPAGDTAA